MMTWSILVKCQTIAIDLFDSLLESQTADIPSGLCYIGTCHN